MSISAAQGPADGTPPAFVEPQPPLKFRPDIEGLRAVAVMLVILDHFNVPGFSGGFIGVDVFFVISGFLITSLLRDEFFRSLEQSRSGRASISFEGFYLRRAKRILPAALTVIAVVLLAAKLLFNEARFEQVQADALWATFFAANIQLMHQATDYFSQTDLVSPLQNFWSLAVEEQFYIVWPALFVLAARLPEWLGKWFDWRHAARAAAVTIGLASLGWSIYATSTSPGSAYFSTLTRAWELGIGAFIALTPSLAKLSRGALARGIAATGALLLVAGLVVVNPDIGYPGLWALFPALGCACLIVAGLSADATTEVGRVLSHRGPRWIGRISYSLYMWHWPIIVFALALFPKGATTIPIKILLFGMSVGAAWLSYRFIEQPYRKLSIPRLPMERMMFLNDERDRLIKMGIAGLVVVAVVGAFARPAPNRVPVQAGVSAQVSKWANFNGNEAGSTSPDAVGDLGKKEWTDAVRKASTTYEVSPAAIDLALAGRKLSPNSDCFTVRSYKEALGCKVIGSGGKDMKWPAGLSTNVALVGNSYAAQWRETIGSVLPEGTQVIPFTMISCDPSAPASDHTKNIYGDDCGKNIKNVEGYLRKLKPGLIIVASMRQNGSTFMRNGPYLASLKKFAPKVLHFIPTPPAPRFQKCLRKSTQIKQCNGSYYPILVNNYKWLEAAGKAAGVSSFSGADVFCFKSICPAFVDDKPVRFDGFHLTADTLIRVRGFVRDAIAKAVGAEPIGN